MYFKRLFPYEGPPFSREAYITISLISVKEVYKITKEFFRSEIWAGSRKLGQVGVYTVAI